MRYSLLIFYVALISILGFLTMACGRENPKPEPRSLFKAVIDGDTFRPDFIQATRSLDTFNITAIKKDSVWMSIVFRNRRTPPAQYTIGGFPDEFNNAYVNIGKGQRWRFTTEMAMGSGFLDIDSLDSKLIKGRFRFNASDLGDGTPSSVKRITVEAGNFLIYYRLK